MDQKFCSNSKAKPTNGKIRIKIENITEEIPVQVQHETSRPQIKEEVTNENRLKAELLSVRTEYSETYLQLQNEKKESNSLRSQNAALVNQNKIMGERIKSISLLENEMKGLLEKVKCSVETINVLQEEKALFIDKLNAQKKEIDVLAARTKQLQFGIQQNTVYTREQKKKNQTKDESSDDGVFEVQKLLGHKMIKKKRHFLVHWKGYACSEDSWVPESRLNCPKILKSYLESANIE